VKIGVDLGTARVRAWVPNGGVILDEPAVMALDGTGRVIAAGQEALLMEGRVPAEVRIVHPIAGGRVADPRLAVELLRVLLRRTLGWRWRWSFHPFLALAISDQEDRHTCTAILENLRAAGIPHAALVPRALAAARGAGLKIDEDCPEGHALVDLGAGRTEISIITMGQVMVSRFSPIAGHTLTEAIRQYLASRRGVEVAVGQAEQAKVELACCPGVTGERAYRLWGRDQESGWPVEVSVTAQELREALEEPLARINQAVHRCLEEVPAGLAADLVERGLVLVGGGALLRGIASYLERSTLLPVGVAKDPQTCTVSGVLAACKADKGDGGVPPLGGQLLVGRRREVLAC